MVDVGNLVDARDGAVGSAGFLGQKFTLHVLTAIFRQRRARPAALLRAVMDQAVFADVDIARAGAAAPIVGLAVHDGFLEMIEARIMLLAEILDLVINATLFAAQRLQLSVAIVNDADGGGKSQFQCAARNRQSILRILDAAADDGVDVHMKIGVLGQHLQFLVENFETLFRHFIGLHVVDGDLHVVEAGAIQALDAIRHQQIAIRDHAGNAAMMADAGDDLVQLRMQQRFATGDGDHAGAEASQIVDAAQHFRQGNGFGNIVKLVAIGAGKIASAHGHNMRHIGMAGRRQRVRNGGKFANSPGRSFNAAGKRPVGQGGGAFRHLYSLNHSGMGKE